MNEKTTMTKKEINKTGSDILLLVDKKLDFFKDVIQKTIIHVQQNKNLEIKFVIYNRFQQYTCH